MDKAPVRNFLLNARAKLVYRERVRKSLQIVENLIPLVKDYDSIGFYVNRSDEVITESYLNYFIQSFKTVSIAKVVGDNLEFYQIFSPKDLKPGAFGILEPTTTKLISKEFIDVMVIPMVGFDERLNRIGYGRGYYDRYLSDYQGEKIGLAFFVQKYHHLPTDKFDIKMDKIVTENQVYQQNIK